MARTTRDKKAEYITVSLYMLRDTWLRMVEQAKTERRSLSTTVVMLAEEGLAARKGK